ncbi:hypothetical protein R8N48_30920, partial [Vibrio sp. Y184]|nr:hypothetical protein [Vibrio sp. Y184]
RYTLGSRAAREGAGILTIANLLDHSDTQNVKVYVANAPEHAVHISKIMNQPLARYASAFAGKLVEDEAEANTENAGAARIPCREKTAGSVHAAQAVFAKIMRLSLAIYALNSVHGHMLRIT